MYLIPFVYPVNSLGCFCLLVIVNNAAINRGVQIPVLSPTVGLYVNSVKFFEELPTVFQWIHHFIFLPAMHKGSDFSASIKAFFDVS